MIPETEPTPDLTDTPLECIEFHEAGHAAVLLARGRRFRYVTIIPNGTVLGECSLIAPPLPDPITPAFAGYLRDRIQSSLAGEIADTLHCGRVITKGVRVGDDDLARAANMAALLTDSAPALVALVEDLMAQTRALLADPTMWRGVVALATALLQDQQLSYAEAHALWVGIGSPVAA